MVAVLVVGGGGGRDSTNNPKAKLASRREFNNDECRYQPLESELNYGKAWPAECGHEAQAHEQSLDKIVVK